jgi:Beta-lactamase class C and other penicillin binding proteins
MSCTKSIVNLAIGHLVDAGKIKSVDQPVHEFYPEWKQGQKKLITIKHLLNHTSGLQNFPNTSVEIYPSPDFVKLALAADVVEAPGSKFRYNNKAVNLLAGIAQVASGRRLDVYCRDELFRPMGITEFGWTLDRAGNPHCMSGLQLKAIDFAKFGQLILNKGLWKGARLVSEKWIEDSIAQGQPHQPICGLLWWRILGDTHFEIDDAKFKELETAGVDKGFLNSLAPLKNKVFLSQEAYYKALAEVLGADFLTVLNKHLADKNKTLSRKTLGKFVGCFADGYLGQCLVVYPEQKLVAVRQIRSSWRYNQKTDAFQDFLPLTRSLGN